jgi:hypothetical protein
MRGQNFSDVIRAEENVDGGVVLDFHDDGVVRGVFELIVSDVHGNILSVDRDENMIMNSARTDLAHLVVSDGAPVHAITHMAFGSAGHDPANIASPLTIDPAGVALTSEIAGIRQPISTFMFPAFNSVTLTAQLGANVGNGNIISEYGLITGAGSLFAKKNRGVLTKNSDLVLTINWTLVF